MGESEISLCEVDLQFYFITKDGSAINDNSAFLLCFEKIKERQETKNRCKYISERESEKLYHTYTKRDICVLPTFDGYFFTQLKKTKALLLGPRCVLSCLYDKTIPNLPTPIFTVAMRDKIVCASGIKNSEKEKLCELVGYMGGLFLKDELTTTTTHLVTETVMTRKYEKAVTNNIKAMKPQWIYDMWNKSKIEDIDAGSDEFYEQYKVPIFNHLNITLTGLKSVERTKLMTIIENNGGHFYGAFKSEVIDILLLDHSQINSKKFEAAVKCKKNCLTYDWIHDSIRAGFCLPVDKYRVDTPVGKQRITVSTPTKALSPTESVFNANCTDISEIMDNCTVNETISSTGSERTSFEKIDNHYKVKLANINLQQAKQSGCFLDGCNIYLCGFTSKEKETLIKILNTSSANYFSTFDSKVAYVIVGAPNSIELKLLVSYQSSATCVTIDWLMDSIARREPAPEKLFLYRPQKPSTPEEYPNVASPASKKNIESMNVTFRQPKPKRLFTDQGASTAATKNDEEARILSQYLENVHQPNEESVEKAVNNAPANTTSDSQMTEYETNTEILDFLKGLTVHVTGFVDESEQTITKEVQEAGGILVPDNFTEIVDYLIVPTDILQYTFQIKAKNIVNEYWLQAAIMENKCVSIEYYHKPIIMDEQFKPFANMTVVFSMYTGYERDYLMTLAQSLGGLVEDKYMRQNKPLLLCPKPEGAKYNGAIRWGLPVVSCEWMLNSYKNLKKMPLEPYLVGKSITPAEELVSKPSVDLEPSNDGAYYNEPAPVVVEPDNQNAFTKPQTPLVIKHKRVAEIAGLGIRGSPQLSPQTPISERLVMDLPTPNRDFIRKVLKEMDENETPDTKRRRLAMGTPDTPNPLIPYECTTPYMEMKDKEFWEKQYRPPLVRRVPTPITEFKKQFWRNALGDQYESPTQISTQGTVYNDPITQPSTSVHHEVAADIPSTSMCNSVVKRLSEYFEKTKEKTPVRKLMPDSAPAVPEDLVDINTESMDIVEWRDPVDFNRSHRFKNRDTMQHKGEPTFSISCNDTELFERTKLQILQLKGIVSENNAGYDSECTHVLCEKQSKSEKIYSAMAAGKWILGIKYIADSAEAGHFLNEEYYEWGNPKAEENLSDIFEMSNPLVRAAYRCRKKYQADLLLGNKKCGAFTGFRVILHMKKKSSFKSLLGAGDGEVLDVCEPYAESKEALTATHCISDSKNRLSSSDRIALSNANIKCVHITFLNAYLTSDEHPNPNDFPMEK